MQATEKTPELTDSIIEIAAKHFADKGFSGARVDEIAADAGVNKATMYYRIGNKQALYETVFVAPLVCTMEAVAKAVESHTDPVDGLRVYIRTLADHMTHRFPYIPSMIMRELLSGAERIPEEALCAMCDVQKILREIISRGIDENVFRPVNPFFVHMLIMGSLTVYTTGEPMRQRMMNMFSEYPMAAEHLNNKEFMLDEIIDMILHSVLKSGSEV